MDLHFENIIFDMDGVLINSEEICNDLWRECAKKYGFPLTDEEIRLFAGNPDHKNCEVCYRNGCDRSIDLLTEHRKLYRELQPKLLKAYDGIFGLLDYLDGQKIKKAVASTTRRDILSRSLETVHLAERFNIIASGDEVERLKPAPDLYLLALSRLGAGAEKTAAVEDSPYGVAAAKAAGLFVFGFLTNYSGETLKASGADCLIPSHAELLKILQNPTKNN